MKSYETYQTELEALKQRLNGSMFYIALPACFVPDAKAGEDDAYFLMVTPKGIKHITQQKWQEVEAREDAEKYAMPQLSAKMERLYFENTATYMPEKRWKTIANAAKNHALPEKMNAEDQRLYEYLKRLSKNDRLEFLEAADARRKANAEQVRKYDELMAQREALLVTPSARSKATSAQLEVPENESAEERMARISSMIASDFGESFEPFW